MATVERLLDQYYAGWANQPESRVIAEAASVQLESNHLPESYGWNVTPQGFIDHRSGKVVRDAISRKTPTDILEGIAFDKIESWAIEYGINQRKNNITALWISPPDPERSSDVKFIFSTLNRSWKGTTINNCSFLVDGSSFQAIDTANNIIQTLGLFHPQFSDASHLRSTPFLFKDSINVSQIVEIIEKQFADKTAIDVIKDGRVDEVTRNALNLGREYVNAKRKGTKMSTQSSSVMARETSYAPSCPSVAEGSSASQTMVKDGLTYKFVKNCGGKLWTGEKCNAKINKFITKGYRCKHCGGEYKGC
jgi:hypothetical protein